MCTEAEVRKRKKNKKDRNINNSNSALPNRQIIEYYYESEVRSVPMLAKLRYRKPLYSMRILH